MPSYGIFSVSVSVILAILLCHIDLVCFVNLDYSLRIRIDWKSVRPFPGEIKLYMRASLIPALLAACE